MNINNLRKHYDQLSPRERVAALMDATMRGDDREHEALLQTAPKETYRVGHHFFLADALGRIAAIHMCELLNLSSALQMGQGVMFLEESRADDDPDIDIDARIDRMMDLMKQAAHTFKNIDQGFVSFCKSEGLNPDTLLINLPGSGILSPDAPKALLGQNTLQVTRRMVEVLYPDDPDPAEVAEMAKGYKDALQRMTG